MEWVNVELNQGRSAGSLFMLSVADADKGKRVLFETGASPRGIEDGEEMETVEVIHDRLKNMPCRCGRPRMRKDFGMRGYAHEFVTDRPREIPRGPRVRGCA